ncbi:N-acetylglucosamine-6-phosphate deacetylase [Phaeobacter inhibens]|uniref:N-acetylglucosamine-6-phosphate deacetylase n=1 Tax=Phaeobacter inhibens TaxID=221822 RepID=UPI0021A81418|nr:N-acetylglucosamine-6-phosphate deacetylase [Phaeobacter inhibens]UWR87743.1 N-acetylglucosamine-6-phosphate deacetylase [Phaeobacter inhibens]
MTEDVHPLCALTGARILTPVGWEDDFALVLRGDQIAAVLPMGKLPEGAEVTALDGGILTAGFVDLQVNGGGGVMFNDAPDLEQLQVIAAAHAKIGATSILPTLITDTPNFVARAIEATVEAIAAGVPGIIGLHLEGPHLAASRKGAHDASLIRPMSETDLEMLCAAASRLPVLKVTLACEAATPAQIRRLSEAGVLVSLGHTDASHADCVTAVAAGARCVTHLFNAQSQLGNREPGVVGAALDLGGLSAGLIADGVHVHPASIRAALAAKTGPGQVFLVSDSMATGGSDIDRFTLNGREIRRDDNRLTLADGTLAGAHLELATAVKTLVEGCDVALETALEMASARPADLIGRSDLGRLHPGARADVLHLNDALELQQVWQSGLAL